VKDPAKYKGPTAKQEAAFREAMDRYLTEMEIRASEAIADKRQWEEHLERCLQQERNDMERKKGLCKENSDFVQQQMEWNKRKFRQDRLSYIESASAHEFPQFTEPADAELRRVMKERQRQMRAELDLQCRTNNALKTIERNRERELEYAQMVANRNEMATQERNENNAKTMERETLTGSWAREVRMKNIWKAIENHTQAASSAAGADKPKLLDFDDTCSVCGSEISGFGASRGSKKPTMGASMNLAKQRQMMGKK